MTLFRMVNGVQVAMSPQEEAAIRAEWAASLEEQQAAAGKVYVRPVTLLAALGTHRAGLMAAVNEDPDKWFMWQRLLSSGEPIDITGEEFGQAWAMMADIIGQEAADELLVEIGG